MIVGLLYLPYTGMCISFAVIGTLMANHVYWDRLVAIVAIYFLGLGISAHAADAMGSKAKPWGSYFTKFQLRFLVIVPLSLAYGIGLYYIVFYTWLLGLIAIVEGFLLLAYNFEWFFGKFHNDFWFSLAWGAVPVLAGYVIQTGRIDALIISVSALAATASYAEIRLSRPYKKMKRELASDAVVIALERKLKILSVSTISIALILLMTRTMIN
jgi:hypothetical protein